MYDEDFHADVYYYVCASCSKEVKTTNLNKCMICNRKLCDDCYIEDFCIEHYNMLTSEGKLKFNELVEDSKNKKKKLNKLIFFGGAIIFTPFVLAPIILSFLFSPNIFGSYYDSFFLFLFFIFVIYLGLPLLFVLFDLKVNGKKQILMKGLREDKISLFNGFAKEMEIQTPKIDKKCENCGRILKTDSEYCDKCGFKI